MTYTQSGSFVTNFYYGAQGALSSVSINDWRPRSVSYITKGDGQIIRRDEADNNTSAGDPHEIWYRFGGKELGYIGNNGATSGMTESASIGDRQAAQGTGAFRNGSAYGSTYTNFAESTGAQINSYSQGSAAGSYLVQRSGETLRSIAEQLWGDSSLWYKIADANGMSGDVSLAEGQRLSLPAGLQRTHNSATTLTPYDANSAIGNVNPTTPQPAKKNGCGVFGQILLAVIAIAVVAVTQGALTNFFTGLFAGSSATTAAAITGLSVGAFAPGAAIAGAIVGGSAAGALGSIVSQGIGVATGIQAKFSWSAVAMAGISGGVAAGVDKLIPGNVLGSKLLGDMARGAANSAITQGLGVATGLQDKFSWAGVAAAGVGNALGQGAVRESGVTGVVGKAIVSGTVSLIAKAAMRAITLNLALCLSIVGSCWAGLPAPPILPPRSRPDRATPAPLHLQTQRGGPERR